MSSSNPRRKRSLHTHRLQNKVNFFNEDNIDDGTVDTHLLSTAPISDFYEDVGEDYENIPKDNEGERFIPFSALPLEMKKDYLESMKKLGSDMEEINSRRRSGRRQESESELPLKVENSHKHETMRIPSTCNDNNNNSSSTTTTATTTSRNPTDLFLDERRKINLMKIRQYNLVENYILPKTFAGSFECELGNFIDDFHEKTRIECISMGFDPKERLISCVMNLDPLDIFYASIEFSLKNRSDKCVGTFSSRNCFTSWSHINDDNNNSSATVTINGNNIVTNNKEEQSETEEEKNDKQIIKDAIVVFRRYYYFTCGCEK